MGFRVIELRDPADRRHPSLGLYASIPLIHWVRTRHYRVRDNSVVRQFLWWMGLNAIRDPKKKKKKKGRTF